MDFEQFCNDYVESPQNGKESPKISQAGQYKPKTKSAIKQQTAEQSFDKNPQTREQKLKEQIEKYQSLSKKDLISELMQEASRQKKQGNLTEQKILQIKGQIEPLLSDQQKKQLDQILKLLR